MIPHDKVRLWSATKRVTSALLIVWLAVNVLGAWFARDLDRLMADGFPIDFWIAAQAALPVYLLIIVIYVVAIERLEARYAGGDEAMTDDTDAGSA
jgi:putative solute:sodium symporter small subunit